MGCLMNKKNLIALFPISILSCFILVGVENANAIAENLDNGILEGVKYCDDGKGGSKKEELKEIASFKISRPTPPGTDMSATVIIAGGDTFNLSGAMVSQRQSFELIGMGMDLKFLMAMNGKYAFDEDGNINIVSGEFQAHNLTTLCLSEGSFKAE